MPVVRAIERHWRAARAAACLAQLGRANEARLEVAEVLRLKPDFRLSTEKLTYKNSSDSEHVFEGMRKADCRNDHQPLPRRDYGPLDARLELQAR